MEGNVAGNIKLIDEKTSSIVERAKEITVTTEEEHNKAVGFIREVIKVMRKEVKDTFDPICEATNAAHKEATGGRKKHLDPLDKAERTVKDAIGKYAIEQAEIAEKAEKEAAAEARKEREKALAVADRRMEKLLEQAGGIQSQIDVLTEQLEDETVELTEQDREVITNKRNILYLKKEEASAKVEDKKEEVDNITHIAPAAVATPRKVAGMNTRFKNVPVLASMKLLALAVVDGDSNIPLSVLEPNMKVIQKLIDADIKIPGIKIERKPITSIR